MNSEHLQFARFGRESGREENRPTLRATELMNMNRTHGVNKARAFADLFLFAEYLEHVVSAVCFGYLSSAQPAREIAASAFSRL